MAKTPSRKSTKPTRDARTGGQVVRQAKQQARIKTDIDLIEVAPVTATLEGSIAQAFKASRGKVNPGLKLGF